MGPVRLRINETSHVIIINNTSIKKSYKDIEILLLNLLNINLSQVHLSIFNGDHDFFLKLSVVLELTHIDSGCPHWGYCSIPPVQNSTIHWNSLEIFLTPFSSNVSTDFLLYLNLGTVVAKHLKGTHFSFPQIISLFCKLGFLAI